MLGNAQEKLSNSKIEHQVQIDTVIYEWNYYHMYNNAIIHNLLYMYRLDLEQNNTIMKD